jgi:uncharacterized protein (TIGR02246 family)
MDKQQADDSAAQVIERFATHLNEGDVDAALALYDEDAVFAVQPDQVARGRDQIREALQGFAALKPSLSGNIVKVLETDDHAVVFNRWNLTGTAPDGTSVEMGGTSADVLRRDDSGEWKVLIDDPWGA